MGKTYDAMAEFFEKDDWPIMQIEGQTAMRMNFQGQNGLLSCVARVDEEKELILFYSYCPITAPENKRPILADFLTRANYGLYMGNFEMNFDDGQVRYKTSIGLEDNTEAEQDAKIEEDKSANDASKEPVQPSFGLMKRLVYTNVNVMDQYMPGIMEVIYGGASPTEAIAKVEG